MRFETADWYPCQLGFIHLFNAEQHGNSEMLYQFNIFNRAFCGTKCLCMLLRIVCKSNCSFCLMISLQICFRQKRYEKLSEMLINLKYFKDSSAVSKRVGSLNVVLVEMLKEVTTTTYKLDVCKIGFDLIKCIVSSYERGRVINILLLLFDRQ